MVELGRNFGLRGALLVAMMICVPLVAAAQSEAGELEEEIERSLAAYEAMEVEGDRDGLQQRLEARERALDSLGRLYQRLADEGDSEVAARSCFQAAELRRTFAADVRALANPHDEGSEDFDEFNDAQILLTVGQEMEATSSSCGYGRVIREVVDGEAQRQWALDAYENWNAMRAGEADQWATEIEELRRGGASPEESCRQDNAQACLEVAHQHRSEGDEANYLIFLRRSCELDSDRCYELAMPYLFGAVGIEQDVEAADRYLVRGCEGGDREACILLSDLLRDGIGLEQDVDRAEYYLELACPGSSLEECQASFR